MNMVRSDVEGHEYRILSEPVPDEIDSLCIELHVLPPFNKLQAVKLIQNLNSQNFNTHVEINEITMNIMNLSKDWVKERLQMDNNIWLEINRAAMYPVNPSFLTCNENDS